MRKPARLLLLALVPLLAGCPRVDTLRLTQDRPEDLEILLEHKEFARIQRLIERHPELDTAGLHTVLDSHISVYEFNSLAEARALAASGDLHGASGRVDEALARLPESEQLNGYRTLLETQRTQRLEQNRRRELLARARHFDELCQIEQERAQLESPGILQRWKDTARGQEARSLGAELLACGQHALEQDDLETASACLGLAESLDDGPEVQAALARLAGLSVNAAQAPEPATPVRETVQVATAETPARNQEQNQQLLLKTEQALEQNDLVAARNSLNALQEKTGSNDEIDAVKQRLDAAIAASIEEMKRKGDRLYRADKVSEAIASWNHALELDPDNSAIQERLARARKVLARLEELKKRQSAQP